MEEPPPHLGGQFSNASLPSWCGRNDSNQRLEVASGNATDRHGIKLDARHTTLCLLLPNRQVDTGAEGPVCMHGS